MAVAFAANAISVWGQARRVHEDEAGLTAMGLALGLAIPLVVLGILLLTAPGDVASEVASAVDNAVAYLRDALDELPDL